jgi:hypothetical protein
MKKNSKIKIKKSLSKSKIKDCLIVVANACEMVKLIKTDFLINDANQSKENSVKKK